jgi:hypothetical protein
MPLVSDIFLLLFAAFFGWLFTFIFVFIFRPARIIHVHFMKKGNNDEMLLSVGEIG